MKLYITPGIKEILDLTKIPTKYEIVDDLTSEVEVFAGSVYGVYKYYENLPNLKYILLTTAGFNQLDLNYLKSKNIKLTNARGAFSIPIAESVIAHILYVNRGLKTYQLQQENHEWIKHNDFIELTDSKVGFLGGGSIAEEILKRLKTFGITSLVFRSRNVLGPFDEVYTNQEGLEKLVSESDYIINTLPLDESTTNLFSKELISKMKRDAFYINVGRAGTHDEEALVDALEKGKIRGAYLDVFNVEPIDEDSKLWGVKNLYITPHNTPSSTKNDNRLEKLVLSNLNNYINQKELLNTII